MTHFRAHVSRWCCWAVAGLVTVVGAISALTLKSSNTGTSFDTTDQVAIFALCVLASLGVLRLTRPAVWADADQIRVRSFFADRSYQWNQVAGLRFDARSRWASVELTNHDLIPMIAIQSIDGERAVAAITALRELHASHRAAQSA